MSKQLVAKAIAERVKNNQVIGLGSGSTTELALEEIAKRIVAEKLNISGVPTSARTALLAEKAGIKVVNPLSSVKIDWAFDGADEVDSAKNLIKGRGAAMLVEKIIAKRAADNFVIIVTEDKLVKSLGDKFPVPVEVVPSALSHVESELKKLKSKEIILREANGKYGPVVTEQNNFIFDVKFETIDTSLETKIKEITGVVESGLFIGFKPEIIISKGNEIQTI